MNEDGHPFYEGPYDAIEKSISYSGKPKKEIAAAVYPGRNLDTAKSLLSRALSPENTDVHINLENLLVIMRETRPEDFIFFLCDEFGFERPLRRKKKEIRREVERQIQKISNDLTALMKRLPLLEE
jgi:hypothetical protein